MLKKFAVVLFHLTMLALVCAIAAYWAIRVTTPSPAGMPPPPTAAVPREADPVLTARLFGLVQAAPVQRALNVQALGVFAAGRDSAAVLSVDGKPPRVFLLDQEVANGARLVQVRSDAVVLEQGGARREIALPKQEMLSLGGTPPPAGYSREGNTLTAPSVAAGGQAPALPPRALQPRPGLPAPPVVQPAPVQQPTMPQALPPQPPPQPLQPQPVQVGPQSDSANDDQEQPIRRRLAGAGRPLSQ